MTMRKSFEDEGRPGIRLFAAPCPEVLGPNRAWYDSGRDRHHVAVIPLERRGEALILAVSPGWTVIEHPLWYLCYRVVPGGADTVRT